MTSEELQKTYSALLTEKLLEIVDNKFEYTELAVTVAIAELSKCQVSEDEIKKYKDDLIQKFASAVKRNIVDDLSLFQKNLFYFLWFPLITIGFKQNFSEDGYLLKLKQANYYSLVGFAFFIFTAFISVNYHLSNLSSLAVWILGFIPAYAFDETVNRQSIIRRLQTRYENSDSKNEGNSTENGL